MKRAWVDVITVPRLALAICGIALLSSAWRAGAFLHAADTVAEQAARSKAHPSGMHDIAAIASAPWFGTAPVAASRSVAIDYRLNGVSIDEAHHSAYALISENGAPEQLYRLHDRLPGGAEITDIQPDYVVLQTTAGAQQLSLHAAD